MSHLNIFNRTKIKSTPNVAKSPKKEPSKTFSINKTLTSNYIDLYNNMDNFIIESTELTCMSYEDMINASVCIIDKLERINNMGTINDDRLGIYFKSDKNKADVFKKDICKTCCQTNTCPGHNGLIKLNHFYINPLYIKYVIWILSSICNECSEILIDEEKIKESGILNYNGAARLQKIFNETKPVNIVCRNPKCNNPYKCTYATQNLNDINENYKIKYKIDKIENERSIEDIEIILKNMSKETLKLLGFIGKNHPVNFILKAILVVPKCVRPPSFFAGSEKIDDISDQYSKIIKYNNKLLMNLSEIDRECVIRDINRNFNN